MSWQTFDTSTITTGGNNALLGCSGLVEVMALNEKVQQMEILMKLQTEVIKSLTEKLEELYYAPGQPGYIKAQVEFAEQKRPTGLTARQARDAFESDEEISDIDE